MKVRNETAGQDRPGGLRRISRRACLPLITCALLSPAALIPLRAQGERWQLFRRDDAGFEIEMPGEPVVRPDEQYPNRKHPEGWMVWTRTFGANLSYNDLSFSIRFYEYTTPPLMEDELRLHREEVIQRFQFRYSRETPLTTYGVPAVELAFEYDRTRSINDRLRGLTPGTDLRMGVERLIIPNNGVINIQVVGKELDATSPLVRRFLDSFKLFPPTSPRRP